MRHGATNRSPGLLVLLALAAGLAPGMLGPACSDESPPGTDLCKDRECGPAPGDPSISCGTCPGPTERCLEFGECWDFCRDRECGPAPGDPSISCGTCTGPRDVCTETGQCWDLCEGRECGEPAAGISCGQCTAPERCGLPGRCFQPGGCPPGTVEIGLTGVCIDAFEKTVAELAAFLTANGPVCHPDWAEDPNHFYPCSANVGLGTVVTIEQLPSGEYVPRPGYEDYPAQTVSFVGAVMACEYFGGRLCTLEEWSQACEGPERHIYPYGDTYDATACNICNESESPEACPPGPRYPEPVGSRPTCEGGYPGLYDMSGNVWEWALRSDVEPITPSANVILGGYAEYGMEEAMCRPSRVVSIRNPYATDLMFGFRCCYVLD